MLEATELDLVWMWLGRCCFCCCCSCWCCCCCWACLDLRFSEVDDLAVDLIHVQTPLSLRFRPSVPKTVSKKLVLFAYINR